MVFDPESETSGEHHNLSLKLNWNQHIRFQRRNRKYHPATRVNPISGCDRDEDAPQ